MKQLLVIFIILLNMSLIMAKNVELKLSALSPTNIQRSNKKVISKDFLIEEDFASCNSGVFPDGWSVTGTNESYWVAANSNYATFIDGHQGEVQYWPAAGSILDTARLITPVINTLGYSEIFFSFNYGIFYKAASVNDDSVEIGLAYKTDNSEWTPIWTRKHISDVSQDNQGSVYNIFDNGVLPDVASVQFAFYFIGNTKDLVVWVVDDFIVEPASQYDIELVSQSVDGQFHKGETIIPELKLINKGFEISSFLTSCIISNNDIELYNEEISTTNLEFLETNTLIFPEITVPENDKAYKIEYISNLNDDENIENDTLIAWFDSNTGERQNVIWEEFTGTWCGWCKYINPAISSFCSTNPRILPIFNHIGDIYEISAGTIRSNYYDVGGYPTCVVDGETAASFRGTATTLSNEFTTNTLNNLNIGSPFSINANIDMNAGGFSGDVTISMIGGVAYPGNVKLRVVATENIQFNDGGENGRLQYSEQVLREYYPNVNGTEINLTKGESETYTIEGNYSDLWNKQKIVIYAYIQNDNNNRILQAVNLGQSTGIDNKEEIFISEYKLDQNYPNPFNPTTTISFNINKASNVKLTVYNTMGKEVRSLVNTNKNVGKYNVVWNGKNNSGVNVPTGIYFYKLQSNNKTLVKKMMLMK